MNVRTKDALLQKKLYSLTFPENGQRYFMRLVISKFLTFFLSLAPYLVPYLPQIPTFFVLFAILNYQ